MNAHVDLAAEQRLAGKVAVVTGAGRGLGRSHALTLAAQGAAVVVNDLGGDVHGAGTDETPAQQVVAEIQAAGGRAVVSGHDVADWGQAEQLIELAVETFGDLHVLVNNAGILRDRMLANMSEDEWDAVVRVHLKGHAAPTRHAVAYWRSQVKLGSAVDASVVHTTSASGFIGSFGQSNYAAAKLGAIGLSNVVAVECGRLGVRSNVVSPIASTRMGQSSQLTVESDGADPLADLLDPANVSAVVAWLAGSDCPATGQVLHVYGSRVMVLGVGEVLADVRDDRPWTAEALTAALDGHLAPPKLIDMYFAEPGLVAGVSAPSDGRRSGI